MTRTAAMTLAGLLFLPSGCMPAMRAGHAAPPPTTPPAGPGAAGVADPSASQMCPLAVPGTQVTAADVAGGASLTFTTDTGDVGELRRRAHAMADMHDRHHGAGAMQHGPGTMGHGAMMGPGMMGGGSMGGAQDAGGHGAHGSMPPSRAAVQDVEKGARIVVQPNDPADLQKLRTSVREDAEHMRQHGCGMPGGM